MSPMREPVTPVIRRVRALEDRVVPEPVQGDRQAVAKSDQENNVRHAPGTQSGPSPSHCRQARRGAFRVDPYPISRKHIG